MCEGEDKEEWGLYGNNQIYKKPPQGTSALVKALEQIVVKAKHGVEDASWPMRSAWQFGPPGRKPQTGKKRSGNKGLLFLRWQDGKVSGRDKTVVPVLGPMACR